MWGLVALGYPADGRPQWKLSFFFNYFFCHPFEIHFPVLYDALLLFDNVFLLYSR